MRTENWQISDVDIIINLDKSNFGEVVGWKRDWKEFKRMRKEELEAVRTDLPENEELSIGSKEVSIVCFFGV